MKPAAAAGAIQSRERSRAHWVAIAAVVACAGIIACVRDPWIRKEAVVSIPFIAGAFAWARYAIRTAERVAAERLLAGAMALFAEHKFPPPGFRLYRTPARKASTGETVFQLVRDTEAALPQELLSMIPTLPNLDIKAAIEAAATNEANQLLQPANDAERATVAAAVSADADLALLYIRKQVPSDFAVTHPGLNSVLKALGVIVMLALWVLPAAILSGCASNDPIAVAEKGEATAFDTINTFVQAEYQNRTTVQAVAPQLDAATIQLTKDTKAATAAFSKALNAYIASATSSNGTALSNALATIQSLATSAQTYQSQLTATTQP